MSYLFKQFDTALRLLNGRLDIAGAPNFNLVVCGGTAMVATELVLRTTRDVDIVALADDDGELLQAVVWSRTHDPSEGYLESVKMFFREFGYEHLVERI
jgi:hypothetical protein